MQKLSIPVLGAGVLALVTVIAFQNCGKVQVASDGGSLASQGGASGGGDGGSDGSGGGDDTGNPTPTTQPPGHDPGYTPTSGPKTEKFVFTPDRKADILLVIDNSTSMQPEGNKLAGRLYGFLNALQGVGIDWQMCILTSDLYNKKGASQNWVGLNKIVLTKADAAARTSAAVTKIFTDTINSFFPSPSGSGDERGIAALSRNVDQRATNGCYRAGSVIAPIILSDEDERSWGGVRSLFDWEMANSSRTAAEKAAAEALLPLESIDKAPVYFEKMRGLGMGNMIVNSIIVDSESCRTTQQQVDPTLNLWFPAFIGTHYRQLSALTSGVVNSICDSDYSNGLTNFANRISGSTHSFTLLCVPKAGTLVVSSPGLSQPNDYVATLSGKVLTVTSNRPTAFEINLNYTCE